MDSEHQTRFYVAGLDNPTPANAIASVLYTNGDCGTPEEAMAEHPGSPIFEVTIVAREVEAPPLNPKRRVKVLYEGREIA